MVRRRGEGEGGQERERRSRVRGCQERERRSRVRGGQERERRSRVRGCQERERRSRVMAASDQLCRGSGGTFLFRTSSLLNWFQLALTRSPCPCLIDKAVEIYCNTVNYI